MLLLNYLVGMVVKNNKLGLLMLYIWLACMCTVIRVAEKNESILPSCSILLPRNR